MLIKKKIFLKISFSMVMLCHNLLNNLSVAILPEKPLARIFFSSSMKVVLYQIPDFYKTIVPREFRGKGKVVGEEKRY
jgi:hypothetical protein